MPDSKLIRVTALLVTIAAWLGLYLTLAGLGPQTDRRTPEATGTVLAQQTLRLLPAGGQVTIIARDTTAFKNPASDIQLASFKKALRKRAAIRSIHLVQVDPLRPVEVPAADFLELLQRSPESDVIVSFMGPPLMSADQPRRSRGRWPAVVAFCPGSLAENASLPALFQQGLLETVIVPRRDKPPTTEKPGNLTEWFERSFQIITAADAAKLLSKSNAF